MNPGKHTTSKPEWYFWDCLIFIVLVYYARVCRPLFILLLIDFDNHQGNIIKLGLRTTELEY